MSRKYHDSPIASYTLTSNKEVVVTAVDVDTDIFTSVGHGLANNDKVSFVLNDISTAIYPGKYLPGGIYGTSQYYIVNKTDDTFQVSTSQGGAAVDITANVNMDLSKLHLEVMSCGDILISNLPGLQKYRVVVTGKHLSNSNYIYPNSVTQDNNWMSGGGTTYGYGNFAYNGNIFCRGEFIIDYSKQLFIDVKALGIRSNTDVANVHTNVATRQMCPVYSNGTITSLTFFNWAPCNGFRIEVYKV